MGEADLEASNRERDEAKQVAAAATAKLDSVHQSFLTQRNFASETKETLVSEQLLLSKKTQESDILRREALNLKADLNKMKEEWDEREARMLYLQEQAHRTSAGEDWGWIRAA